MARDYLWVLGNIYVPLKYLWVGCPFPIDFLRCGLEKLDALGVPAWQVNAPV